MAKFNTDTLSLFHTFSKTQVNSDANKPQFSSLGNTVNKSGHTVQSNEIWTESIPFFGLGVPGDFSSTAKVNDLVKDADGIIWQRNDTPYTDANGTYWTQKTKSITGFTKDADGKYTYTEVDGALVDGSYLINASGVPTVKYHAKKQLTPLVSDNNAFIDSENDASRLKIDGKWVEQFIGVTDAYVNGSASVSYAPVLFSTSTATSPLKAGAGEDYLDYCATGIILWDKAECTGNEVISCFEYVGGKLDATLTSISDSVKDIVNTTMQGVVASVGTTTNASTAGISVDSSITTSPKIDITTGSVTEGETKLVSGGAVHAVTNALAGRIAQLEGIQHFSVEIVDTLPETPVENTIYLVPEEGVAEGTYIEYIAYKPAGSEIAVTEKIGSTALDLTGYTTDAEHEALQSRVTTTEEQIATITSTDATTPGSIAKALADAKSYTDDKIAEELEAEGSIATAIAEAKRDAIADAKVSIESSGEGIRVSPNGEGKSFTISATDYLATAESVTTLTHIVESNKKDIEATTAALDTRLTEAEGKITALEEEVAQGQSSTQETIESIQKDIADLASTEEGNEGRVTLLETEVTTLKGKSLAQTSTGSENVTVTTTGSVADGLTSINVTVSGLATSTELSDLDTRVGTAEGDIADIKTDLAEGGNTAKAIAAAQKTATDALTEAQNKIASVSVDSAPAGVSFAGTTDAKLSIETATWSEDSFVEDTAAKIATGETAQAVAKYEAGLVSSALSNASLAASSEDSSALITIETGGKLGEGMTIAVTDTALTKAIEDAEINAVAAAKAIELSAEDTSDTTEDTDAKVTVKLSGTVQTPSIEVSTANIASVASVQALSDRVTALHQTPQFKVAVVTMPKGGFGEGGWQTAVENGIVENTIYLVPDDVLSDEYVEYVAYKSGEFTVTERIGTTKTDLKDYSTTEQMNVAIADAIDKLDVASTTLNGITYSQTDGKISISVDAIEAITDSTATDEDKLVTAGAVKSAINTLNEAISSKVAEVTGGSNGITISTAEKNADGKVVATLSVSTATLVENDAIVETITSGDEEKFVTAAQILAAIKLAKPENYVAAISGYSSYASGKDNLISSTQGSSVYIIDESTRGYDIIANMAVASVDQEDGSTHITITNGINYSSLSSDVMTRLNHVISIKDEVAYSDANQNEFKLETSAIKHSGRMFFNSSLTSFDSTLVSLKTGVEMFCQSTDLSYFNSDMPNLTNAAQMFAGCYNLNSFVCDLSSVKEAYSMFASGSIDEKFTFVSDLSSLESAVDMFHGRHLTEESLMFVADTIKTHTVGTHLISFGANESLTDTEIELFQEIHEKGWDVYVAGNQLTFDATEQTNETGETTSTPKPYYAKPVEVEESKAQFIGEDGKFYRVHGGHYIFVNDPETYGMFTSREDAIANMRLTKYVKPTE